VRLTEPTLTLDGDTMTLCTQLCMCMCVCVCVYYVDVLVIIELKLCCVWLRYVSVVMSIGQYDTVTHNKVSYRECRRVTPLRCHFLYYNLAQSHSY